MLVKRKEVNHKAEFIMVIYVIIAVITFIIYLANVARSVECAAYGLILFATGFLICFYMVESYYQIEEKKPARKR